MAVEAVIALALLELEDELLLALVLVDDRAGDLEVLDGCGIDGADSKPSVI